MSLTNWTLLLVTAALFGSSFPLINIAVKELTSLQLAAARITIAAPVLLALLYLSKRRLPAPGPVWWPLLVLGVLTAALPYFAIAWGQERINSSLGGILFATIPIFTLIFAPLLTPEPRLPTAKVLAVLLAFAGVALSIGVHNITSIGPQTLGALVTLGAALSYALGNIYARRQGGLDPVVIATGQLLTGALLLLPLASMFGGPLPVSMTNTTLLATLLLGVMSTALPVLLMFTLIKRVGATQTSLLAFFIPVAAVLLGVVARGDRLDTSALVGFALIIGGAIWASRPAATAAPKSDRPARGHKSA